MAKFTKDMVVNYANKLLIGLTDDEIKMVLDEFDVIDSNIDLINQIPNICEVEPMTHCLDNFVYELREDVPEESIEVDVLLNNCDSVLNREVKLPRVVD